MMLAASSSSSSLSSLASSRDDKDDDPLQTAVADTSSDEDQQQRRMRYRNMVPTMDALDKRIIATALPSMVNLAVVPIVNAVDTFWVGRMGVALALAGQGAANQAFFTLFFLINYLPTITAPLVATAVGSGDIDQARRRVCESLFLTSLLGGLGTILLCVYPRIGLAPILDKSAPAMAYAVPYLRVRAISLVPALIGSTGFAAFRGALDTVTPLKVSLAAKYVVAKVCVCVGCCCCDG
jgi:multidrug resistance protein, MATE family